MNAPDRHEFLARRKVGIGGSDISAVLGMNPWRTPVEVWLDKTSPTVSTESELRLRFGTVTEEFIAREYSLQVGLGVVRHNAMCQDDKYPHALMNVDRLVIPKGQKVAAVRGQIRTDKFLECKTVGDFAFRMGEWGDPGTDQIPTYYLLQIHWGLGLSPCTEADLAALVGAGESLKIYTIKKDRDLEEELLRRGHEWWEKHVVGGVAPEPTCEADVLRLFPKDRQDTYAQADEVVAQAVKDLCLVKGQIKNLESEETDLRFTVTKAIADASVLLYQGQPIATWKAAKDSMKTDWQALAKSLGATPEQIAAATTATPGSRRLNLK